ncbi:MAG: hypothetical protein EOQ99_33865, partial [Mesorhizobium sp.]
GPRRWTTSARSMNFSSASVEAVKAAKSVYFSTLADIIASLAKAEREGHLRERHDAVFIERWLESEVEAGERLDGG